MTRFLTRFALLNLDLPGPPPTLVRSPRRRRLLPHLIATLLLGSNRSAPAAETVRLDYNVPEVCPSRDDFIASVEMRGSRFASTSKSLPQALTVHIRKEAARFSGSIRIQHEHTTTEEREVYAPDCREVVNAIAVVAAIALRSDRPPETPQPPKPDVESPAPVVPDAAPSNEPSTSEPSHEPTPHGFRGHSQIGPAARHRELTVPEGTVELDNHGSLTAYVGPQWGPIPNAVLPRYDLAVTNAGFLTIPTGEQTLLGLSRLRLGALGPAVLDRTDGRTELYGATFGMSLCLSPEYDTRGWILLGCVEYGGGILQANVFDRQNGQTSSRTNGFGMVGVNLEAQYNFGSLFHGGLKLSADSYLGEITAERADGSRVFDASTLAASISLGIGMHF